MREGLGAVVFDFDGLLADTEMPIFEATAAAFAELGHLLDVRDWASVIGLGGGDAWAPLADRLGIDIDWDDLRSRQEARLIAAPVAPDLQPGVADLLDDLDRAGVPYGVASSSSRSWVEGHLDRLGVASRFATYATFDRAGVGKPAPDVYLLACRDLGVDPSAAVAIEDAAPGIAAARAAGLVVVAVPSEITRWTDLGAADHAVDSLRDLSATRLAALRRATVGDVASDTTAP